MNIQFHNDYRDVYTALLNIVPDKRQLFNVANIPLTYSEPEANEISLMMKDFMAVLNENIKFINLPIARKISIFNDFSVLVSLYRIMVAHRFDVVHSLMPKTSLLGMLAAFLARVPIRLHIFTGQVWANHTGVPRFLFKTIDSL